jgi:hypothetical protein
MAELKHDPTHPLKHEQCYLCFTTLVEPPPANAPSREELRRPHKEYMARLESEGRLFAAGLLKNEREKETSLKPGRRRKRSHSKNPIPRRVCAP